MSKKIIKLPDREVIIKKKAVPPMENKPTLYARPKGNHYHTSKHCLMLMGDQFEVYGYKEITPEEAKKRKLTPCSCVSEVPDGK